MNRTFVIFNPTARGATSFEARHFLESTAARDSSITLAPTTQPGDATRLAAQAVAEKFQLIIAVGGDGTINGVANGIGLSGVPLAVLPQGTVNVFARELGIPRSLEAAWNIARRGNTRAIDLGHAEASGSTRYFVQLAGVGFDAMAVRRASWELKKKIGPLSYVWAGMKAPIEQCGNMECFTSDGTLAARGHAVFVGNGRYYGGSFSLFPQAKLDDGLLDVCVFETVSWWDAARHAQAVVRGVHTTGRGVRYFQTSEIRCVLKGGTAPFELDGEDAGDAPVRFTVAPRALRVVVPARKE